VTLAAKERREEMSAQELSCFVYQEMSACADKHYGRCNEGLAQQLKDIFFEEATAYAVRKGTTLECQSSAVLIPSEEANA
jgi:hypothetical protein